MVDVKDELHKAIESAEKLLDVVNILEAVGIDRERLRSSAVGGYLYISLPDITELEPLRERLRSLDEGWRDTLASIWHGGGNTMCATWENPDFPWVHIWLTFNSEAPPEGLLKPGCRIETTISEGKTVVCGT